MSTDQEFMWVNEYREVSIVEVSRFCGLTEAEIAELVDYGALIPREPTAAELRFSAECLDRLRRASRLCHDLELETPAMALVLSFLERIDTLEAEVRQLSAQLPHRR